MQLITSTSLLLEELQKENNSYFVKVSPYIKSDKTIILTLKTNTISVYSSNTNTKEIIPLDELEDSVLSYYIDDRSLYSYN